MAVPSLTAQLSGTQRFPVGQRAWLDTELVLHPAAPVRWKNKLTDERLRQLAVLAGRESLRPFPCSITKLREVNSLEAHAPDIAFAMLVILAARS